MSNTLLIGAGFSKNFGGYLAKEVFLKIFNLSSGYEKIRHVLHNFIDNDDFESVIDYINSRENNFTEEDKKTINKFLLQVFDEMDRIIQRNMITPVFSYLEVISFIVQKFSINHDGSGYIFSLNQDLLIERLFHDYLKIKKYYSPSGWFENQGELLPYYGPINSPFYKYHSAEVKKEFDDLESATKEKIDEWCSRHGETYETRKIQRPTPCLIKLHGSFYWGDHEKKIWIMGKSKQEKIQDTAILNFYYKKFNDVLKKPDSVLYIIGYSFCDDHINQIIFDSCLGGARLIVFDLISLSKWLSHVNKISAGKFQSIWLLEYYDQPFEKLFSFGSHDLQVSFDGDLTRSREKIKSIFRGFRY